MSDETISDTPQWYAIHTHPKQEDRADNNLQAWKVETFNPKFRERKYNQFSNKPTYSMKSLFSGYIFARFEVGTMLRKVWYTRGVHSVVGFGKGPIPISNAVLDIIRSQVQSDGCVKISEDFKAGDPVVVKGGPLKSLTGIFEQKMNDSERVAILLTAVRYQGRILIEKDQISKLD
jgi:transcription antitermination factor NusG